MAIREEVTNYIKGLDVDQRIQLWNRYCEQTNTFDDEIYSIESDFDEIMADKQEVERHLHSGDQNYHGKIRYSEILCRGGG